MIVCIFFLFIRSYAFGQSGLIFPTIGKPCPKATINNIKYYKKTNANLSDFRGKWLLLDFWSRYCGACVASFPKMNEKRKKFADRMEVLMIGGYYTNPYSPDVVNERDTTERIFASEMSRHSLSLPCAFDSVLNKKWDIQLVPYLVIIDPRGIVRAITTGISDEKLDSLLNGFSPELRMATRGHEDVGPEVRPSIDNTIFTSVAEPNSYNGPRFAFSNDNDFPIIVSTDNSNGRDTLGPRQIGKFHNGDYRECQHVYNVTYDLAYGKFRGRINALHYSPRQLKGPAPSGDWIIHFKWDQTWRLKASRINY